MTIDRIIERPYFNLTDQEISVKISTFKTMVTVAKTTSLPWQSLDNVIQLLTLENAYRN